MGTVLNTALLAIVVALAGWNLKTTHEITLKMTEMEHKLANGAKNRWSSAHQKIWAGELKEKNPALQVPDPLDVQKAYEP